MNEYEARLAKFSWNKVNRIVEDHGLDFQDFIDECGDLNEYEGSVVLDWLGY